jgi:hypothetical protein
MKISHHATGGFADRLLLEGSQRGLFGVFWIYGVLASTVLAAVLAWSVWSDATVLAQALIPVAAVYTAWILLVIWRHAPEADPLWGTMARWLTVAWAINAIMALGFLQADLLA